MSHRRLIERARELDRTGDGEPAAQAYATYLRLVPSDWSAWTDYGGLLMVLDRLEAADKACERALSLKPGHVPALINRVAVEVKQGRLDKALETAREAQRLAPQELEPTRALAEVTYRLDQLPEAEDWARALLDLDPGHVDGHGFLARILHRQGRWEELYQEELRFLDQTVSESERRWEKALVHLRFGHFNAGWEDYELRWSLTNQTVRAPKDADAPQWDGRPFPGKTLLLRHEQGFGDTFMFVRFASMVKALGGKVVLEAQRGLEEVIATCPGIDQVVVDGDPLPPFDLQLPLLSLGRVLQVDLNQIPAEIPYLDVPKAPPNRDKIARVLSPSQGLTRIGIVWAGNPTHINDAARSMPLATLAPLGELPGVVWHSLQLGVSGLPFPRTVPLAPLLRSSFSDTAYALSGMDLVITVDTSIAHLAGALGIPTFVLLPYRPDWRWLMGREDSPWYPSLRLYRQPEPGDWHSVVKQVLSDLSEG